LSVNHSTLYQEIEHATSRDADVKKRTMHALLRIAQLQKICIWSTEWTPFLTFFQVIWIWSNECTRVQTSAHILATWPLVRSPLSARLVVPMVAPNRSPVPKALVACNTLARSWIVREEYMPVGICTILTLLNCVESQLITTTGPIRTSAWWSADHWPKLIQFIFTFKRSCCGHKQCRR